MHILLLIGSIPLKAITLVFSMFISMENSVAILFKLSQRDNCYISAGGNAGTHRVCPEALKVATLPLYYHSLG
jgi:hypothetical protein